MEKISDRLRIARESQGFATADEFADHAQIDRALYRSYEEGTRDPSPQAGYRLAEMLGVDWISLLYGSEYVHTSREDIGYQGAAPRRRERARELAYVGGRNAPAALMPSTSPAPPPSPAIAFETATPFVVEPRLPPAPAEAPTAPAPRAPRAEIPADIVVDELDSRLAGGAGLARASETPLREWHIPRDIVRQGSTAGSASLKMISVVGDDMEPALRFPDRVLVDTADTQPSPPGIFLVWDGMSLILRRIEIVPGSEPILLRISADNPKYQPIERRLAETVIQGRVLAKWSWV